MNINNSSDTIVIDPKSQAAIDAVRDRITLLDAENARLTKLKSNLDAEVRKVEADLAYKTTLLEELNSNIITAKVELDKIIATEVEASNAVDLLESKEAQMQKDLNEQAATLTEREKRINERESKLEELGMALYQKETNLGAVQLDLDAKKSAIAALYSKL